jgi:hypothetical protein
MGWQTTEFADEISRRDGGYDSLACKLHMCFLVKSVHTEEGGMNEVVIMIDRYQRASMSYTHSKSMASHDREREEGKVIR